MKDMLELTWSRFWTHQKNGKGSKQRALIVLEDMEWMDLRPAEITRNSLLKVCDFYLNKGNKCSGQLNPDTWLGRSSAFAGAIPSLC
ncbi:hypothetical protein ACK3Y1_19305, partial [Aeromonas caviae]